MKRLMISLGFVAASSTALMAQTPLERAKAALPADAAHALEQTVAGANARGLPTDALVDKALEGAAKHAPANLILDAVRRRLDLLVRADADLRAYGPPAGSDVTSVADALQRGVSDDVVKKVRAGARSGEPVSMAVHTIADLLERGVPVDVAMTMLSEWRSRGGSEAELENMPADVDRLVRDGETPGAAGRAIAASHGKPVVPPGLLKKGQPKVNPGKGRTGPPVPPGSGPPAGKGAGNGKKH